MSKILLITEGKNPDISFIKKALEVFGIKGDIVWANVGTIYAFYKEVKKDPYIDIVSYIKKKYKVSKEYSKNEIPRLYFFLIMIFIRS